MSHLALSDTTCHAVGLYPCLGSCLSQRSSAATCLTSLYLVKTTRRQREGHSSTGQRVRLISAIKRISDFERRARDSFESTRCESLESGVLSGNLTFYRWHDRHTVQTPLAPSAHKMVVSMAPGPPTGFSTHPGGFTTGNLLSSGFTSVDIPPSDQRNSNNGNPPNGMHEYGVTHLSGARMHLKLPQRQRDTSLLDEGYSPSPITTTPETVHRRSSSIMARARAQTVSDQTDLRNYPSISSIAPDSVDNEEHETAGPSMNGQQPHVLTAHPTPSISSSSSKRQIITLDTNSNALQSLDPSLSGLGWEDPSGSRPESPLPLPSPMPHVDDQPGSKSIFCTGSRSNASSQEAGKAGVPSTSRSTEAERKASKTSAFFSVSFGDEIPTPPRPLRESEIKEKTINAMSSCPSLHEQASQMPGSQTASSTTTSRASRNSIFDTADGSTVLPTRNRQRSGLGLGTSPARRVESSHLHEGTSATTPENEEPVFSEFSSFSARRATLAAAGVNRARSLNETTRRKSNAIFGESHALLPPSRAPPSNLSTIQRPLQDLPSPVGTFAAYTISPSPSPSTGTFGDRLNMNERSSSLRTTILGIPDSRAVTMPFPANAPNAPPSSASSTLPISPVESTSSIVDNPTRSTVLPLQPPPNSLLSPPKRLTREVSNSNCSDSSTADALPDKINVKPGDILEPEDRSKEGESPRVIHAWKVEKVLGEGAFSRVWSARSVTLSKGKGKETETDASTDAVETGSDVVAIKMMDKRICKDNDRTRISFEREVAVLKVSL